MTDKKTEKLLKRPDAFQTFMFHAMDWFRTHERKLLLFVLPVFVILLAIGGWEYYRHMNQDRLKEQLAEIDKAYTQEEKEPNKKRKQLRDEIRNLETAAKAANKDAKDVSNPQIDAKKKELDAIAPDHKPSLAKYLDFFKANEKNADGWRAGMKAVEIQLKLKDTEAASQVLKTILDHSLGLEFYQVQVRLMYVAVLEDMKKFQEALTELEKVIPLASEDIIPRALLTKGRLQIELGNKEEGVKTLNGLISDHSSAPEARQALAIKAL